MTTTYTEDQMTPWFPGTVNPERPGVYEVQCHNNSNDHDWKFSHFDGWEWGGVDYTPEGAKSSRIRDYTWLNAYGELKRWRGLNFNPEQA